MMKLPPTPRVAAMLAVLCVFTLGSAPRAAAASLGAASAGSLWNCPLFGDPLCTGAPQVFLPQDTASEPNATAGQTVQAGTSYIDPRIGAVNSTWGTGIAGFGEIRTSAGASVSSQPPLVSTGPNLMVLSTFANGGFDDSITIVPQDPALLGQPGTYTASFLVDGLLGVGGANANPGIHRLGYADWRIRITSGTTTLGSTNALEPGFHGYKFFYSDGTTFVGGLGDGVDVIRFTAPIVFGTPFTLGVGFQSGAQASVYAAAAVPPTQGTTTGNGQSAYGNTAAWNGIEAVRFGGQAVTAFSVVSDSGVNYAMPVPEPGTAVLLIGSLSLLAAQRLRHGRAPTQR